MDPHDYLRDVFSNGDKVLSLCCGIGQELARVTANIELTGVDIVPEYIAEFSQVYPNAHSIISDILEYLKAQPTDSFDFISIIDGIEHLTKKDGWKVIENAKRVAKRVIIFTPDRLTKNEPVHTWGIDGGDLYQKHLSGWDPEELKRAGFDLVYQRPATTLLGQDFNESMYLYENA